MTDDNFQTEFQIIIGQLLSLPIKCSIGGNVTAVRASKNPDH